MHAGDGAAVVQLTLEAHAVDRAETAGGAVVAFGADRAAVVDGAGEQARGGSVQGAVHTGAFQADAVTGGGGTGRGGSAADDLAGVVDVKVVAGFGELDREGGAFEAFARVDHARGLVVKDKALRGGVGVDGAVTLRAGGEDGAGVVDFQARAVDVQRPAVGLDAAGVVDHTAGVVATQAVDGVAEVKAVLHAFDQAGVVQGALEADGVGDPKARHGAVGAFAADDAGGFVGDGAFKHAVGGAVEVGQPHAVGRGSAGGADDAAVDAALDRARVGDRCGGEVGDFQGEARALVALARVDGAAVVHGVTGHAGVGVDRAVALAGGAQDGAGVVEEGAGAQVHRAAVRADQPAGEVGDRAVGAVDKVDAVEPAGNLPGVHHGGGVGGADDGVKRGGDHATDAVADDHAVGAGGDVDAVLLKDLDPGGRVLGDGDGLTGGGRHRGGGLGRGQGADGDNAAGGKKLTGRVANHGGSLFGVEQFVRNVTRRHALLELPTHSTDRGIHCIEICFS